MKYADNRRKLKNLLFNSHIQFRLAAINALYLIFVMAIFIFIIISPFYYDMFKPDDLYVKQIYAKIFILLTERLFIALILISLISFIHQLIISHRIVGPLVNFSNSFKKIAQGDLSAKIHLRHRDYLKKEALEFNKMIESLSSFMRTLKEDHDHLVESLESLEPNIIGQEELNKQLQAVKQKAHDCSLDLAQVKLGGIDCDKKDHKDIHLQPPADAAAF